MSLLWKIKEQFHKSTGKLSGGGSLVTVLQNFIAIDGWKYFWSFLYLSK